MPILDLSNAGYVARLRYIQALHEAANLRNPDTLVGHFLSLRDRWNAKILGREELTRLREDPFYYYLLARTKYYDAVYRDAVTAGVVQIANIGCGADTRPYRLGEVIRDAGVRILECDQPAAVERKRKIAKRWRGLISVDYMPIDLNLSGWPDVAKWLKQGGKTLVVMEGVSPYINAESFTAFLRLIAAVCEEGSFCAYDYKIKGVNDAFGKTERTQHPFRLSHHSDEVSKYHEGLDLTQVFHATSWELCARLIGNPRHAATFCEDAVVQVRVGVSVLEGVNSGAEKRA